MVRGPIFKDEYRPQFSGHETFPLRYGWLKKAFDRVHDTEHLAENKSACWGEDAIARFGVGKNMVASMRHWATVTGIISEVLGSNLVQTTESGQFLFGAQGLDPFLEHPASLWLIHWHLSALATKTTWFWAFNHYPGVSFSREDLVLGLERLAKQRAWSQVASSTLKHDVACFVRTYAALLPSARSNHDDFMECPLTELGLIKADGNRHDFRFVRGPKPSLGNGMFVYSLIDFWSRTSQAATFSFESIVHDPGSPGRIFLLDENDVADRLSLIDQVTDGALQWSETAGLKQVVRGSGSKLDKAFSYLALDYNRIVQEVA